VRSAPGDGLGAHLFFASWPSWACHSSSQGGGVTLSVSPACADGPFAITEASDLASPSWQTSPPLDGAIRRRAIRGLDVRSTSTLRASQQRQRQRYSKSQTMQESRMLDRSNVEFSLVGSYLARKLSTLALQGLPLVLGAGISFPGRWTMARG
jgi:hypothetical protein